MTQPDNTPEQVRAAEAAKAREELNRRLQTNLDLGRTIAFQPSTRGHSGLWNTILVWLGAAILVAVVVVNLI
jgi:hypothetical protein